jgi:hypothetical protein
MSEDGFATNSAFSVSESLRPGPGETLDRLAFATYSLDLVSLVALVLALSGRGEAGLDAGKLRLLDALEEMLPKIDVVHQKDRLKATTRHHHILHLLDGHVHPVQPPPGSSFHPKVALARYLSKGSKVSWRLWIGSRNLTASEDRDAGLLLCGAAAGGRGSRHPEIAAMAASLLAPLDWVRSRRAELEVTRWSAPEGTKLRSIQWRNAGAAAPFNVGRARDSRVLAISPFADVAGCEQALQSLADRRLLTIAPTAAQIGPLEGVDVRLAGVPDLTATHKLEAREDIEADGPEPVLAVGLHAKLFVYDDGGRGCLYIGSANCTGRGLLGPNAEVLAELDVAATTVAALHDLALCHPTAILAAPDVESDAARAAERALDRAIAVVLDAEFSLVVEAGGIRLTTSADLDGFLAEHELECWLLTRPDERVRWPSGARTIVLSDAALPLRLQTVMVCFCATTLCVACPPRSWMQAVEFPGFDRDARDLAAKAEFVRLAGASAWLRGQLEGILPPEHRSWSSFDGHRMAGRQGGAQQILPLALEEVLSAWARNPDDFEARVGPIDAMLSALGEQLPKEDTPEARDALAEWRRVEAFWRTIRDSLVEVLQ